jgi:hypothetical protein
MFVDDAALHVRSGLSLSSSFAVASQQRIVEHRDAEFVRVRIAGARRIASEEAFA